jgi:hypothetical protein
MIGPGTGIRDRRSNGQLPFIIGLDDYAVSTKLFQSFH